MKTRPAFRSSTARRRLLLLTPALLAVVAVAATALAITMLYETALQQEEAQLAGSMRRSAKLIESIAQSARWDREKTLELFNQSGVHTGWTRRTGEFNFAVLDTNAIRFLLVGRHDDHPTPPSVPYKSDLAVPMRRALQGLTGTIIAPDYRGEEVLAAYGPVKGLKWGIVAKIDLAELRAPFIHAAITVLGLVTFLVVVTTFLLLRLVQPVIVDLERSKDAAEVANRTKTEFLANMSHEIRTPMTAILGFADVLSEHVSSPRNVDAVDTIRRNGEHLLGLINNILDLSKIDAGKVEVEHVPWSPGEIVLDVVSLMRVRAEAKGLTLDVEYGSPVPETIETDPTRLRQILLNLVGNAIKFTERGVVRIVVRTVDRDTSDPRLQFSVIDTGIGMTDEQLERIFTPFEQADTSTTRQYGGTGLGLVISQRLAGLLGGSLSVESVPKKGSTFRLSVATGPIDQVKMVTDPEEAEADAGDPKESSHREDARIDGHVLLAEDGPDNQRLISFLLEKGGAKVTIADNGQIALDLIRAERRGGHPFAAVLMDMQMPVMDGYEATRRLRAEGCDLPVIALTAHAMVGDRDRCLAAGCSDYLTKPIDRHELVRIVAKYAAGHASRHTGSKA